MEFQFAALFLNACTLHRESHETEEAATPGLGASVKFQVFQHLRLRTPHSPSGFSERCNPQLKANNDNLKGYNSGEGGLLRFINADRA